MHIEVTELDVGPGKEYLPQEYPGPGAYLNRRMNYVFILYPMPGITTNCVMAVPAVSLVKEDVAPPAPTGMSESFVLKALAICQNPNLAAELTAKV